MKNQPINVEITSDRLGHLLAEHFGFNWAAMNPMVRDRWREQSVLLLEYVQQTAFGGLASRPADDDAEVPE